MHRFHTLSKHWTLVYLRSPVASFSLLLPPQSVYVKKNVIKKQENIGGRECIVTWHTAKAASDEVAEQVPYTLTLGPSVT